MLNKMGHCSSYEEVEIIDTCLAKEIIAKSEETGVTIPSNIFPGNFVQMAADNNDINEETVDGKKTQHTLPHLWHFSASRLAHCLHDKS